MWQKKYLADASEERKQRIWEANFCWHRNAKSPTLFMCHATNAWHKLKTTFIAEKSRSGTLKHVLSAMFEHCRDGVPMW